MIDKFDQITIESLNDFFKYNLDIMFAVDFNGKFIRVNNTWQYVLGYSLDDLKDVFVLDLVHPDYRDFARNFVINIKSSKNNFITDIKYKTKSGEYKYFECKVHLLEDMYFISARDITSLTHTKKLLKESQSQIQNNLHLQSLISNIAFNLMNDDNFDHALYSSISQIGEFLGISSVLIFIDSKIEPYSYLKYAWFNKSAEDSTYTEHTINYSSVPSYKSLLSRDHIIFFDQSNYIPVDLKTHFLINNISSIVVFPIYINSEIKGVLRFDCYSDYIWDESVVESLKTLSKIISSSYDNFLNTVRLKENQRLLDMFFDNSKDGFFFMMLDEPILWNDYVDKDELMNYIFNHQRVTRVNKAILEQYSSTEKDLLGTTPADFYLNNISRGKRLWRKLFDTGMLHIDGTIPTHFSKNVMIKGDYVCLYDNFGRITGHFAVQRDVTREKMAQTIIAQSEMRFSQLAENIEEIFWIREGVHMSYVNSAFERITGISMDEIKKNPSLVYDIVVDEDKKKIFKTLNENPNKFDMRYRIKTPNGEIKWIWERGSIFKCPITNVIRTVGVSADITHMKQLEEKLELISSIDELTQIYNRKYVFNRLKDISEDYIKNETVFSFAILDIDFFKNVNDNYGHVTGDFILKEFAKTIKNNIRSSDILGRYGGEEFVIVLKGTNKEDASYVVEKILNITRNTTFEYNGENINFTFSGGISDALEFSNIDFNITDLVNLADERLYIAKNTGRNKIVIDNKKLLKS